MKKVLLTLLTLLLFFPSNVKADEKELVDLSHLFLYSANYILVDQDTETVLASKNPQKKIHPASITKALTLITALELLESTDLNKQYTAPQEAFDGLTSIASVADFQPGDKLSLNDYLYGIMLPSGADATRIISMYLTNTPEGLANKMNETAQKIGMSNSHFANTSGLDEDDHYSTVEDLALLIQYSLKNKEFRRFYTTVTHTTAPTSKHPDGIKLKNHFLNGAIDRDFPLLYGAKSGYTELAERALSSVATDGNLNLIFVSTNAPYEDERDTHLTDAINVYKEVFANYGRFTLHKEGDIIATLDIKKVNAPYVIKSTSEYSQFLEKQLINSEEFKMKFNPIEGLTAPIEKDTFLGTLSYISNDEVVYTEAVNAPENISVSFQYTLFSWLKILVTAFFVLIIVFIIAVLAIRNYKLHKIRKHRQSMGWVKRK